MATGEARTVGASSERDESLANQVLSFAAMAGAVCGAIAGATLGAEIGSAFPVLCGVLGTMLGSGLAAGACCLIADVCNGAHAGYEIGHARDYATTRPAVTSTARVE